LSNPYLIGKTKDNRKIFRYDIRTSNSYHYIYEIEGIETFSTNYQTQEGKTTVNNTNVNFRNNKTTNVITIDNIQKVEGNSYVVKFHELNDYNNFLSIIYIQPEVDKE
jgi:hypothetical protein